MTDTSAWARSVARTFEPDHWKGLRWLDKNPAPYMFPNGGSAHATLVLQRCAAEPTSKKPYWSLSDRGRALLDYATELAQNLDESTRLELVGCLISLPLFRELSKPLRIFRPHLVVPSSVDLHTTRITNLGHGVGHQAMTTKERLAFLTRKGN